MNLTNHLIFNSTGIIINFMGAFILDISFMMIPFLIHCILFVILYLIDNYTKE